MKEKTIIRNGQEVTLIKLKGDTNWQLVEQING